MSEHQAPKRGVYSSLIARRHDLMQEFEKKSERFKELLLQEMVTLLKVISIRYMVFNNLHTSIDGYCFLF